MNDDGAYVVDEEVARLTVLVCKALAKCWAPSTPILLKERSSVVRFYVE